MVCKFCNRECKNSNSLRNHERLCHKNSNRQIIDHAGCKNPHFGKKGSNQFMSARKKGREVPSAWNKNKHPLGTKQSVETRAKKSKIQSRILEERGGSGFTHIKYYEISNLEGTFYKVRGTWELKYAKYLNLIGVLWIRKVYLQYVDDIQIKRIYTPDFYLPLTNEYKEIKGYFSKKDKAKLLFVEKQNKIKIDILFKKDLESLGIQL